MLIEEFLAKNLYKGIPDGASSIDQVSNTTIGGQEVHIYHSDFKPESQQLTIASTCHREIKIELPKFDLSENTDLSKANLPQFKTALAATKRRMCSTEKKFKPADILYIDQGDRGLHIKPQIGKNAAKLAIATTVREITERFNKLSQALARF